MAKSKSVRQKAVKAKAQKKGVASGNRQNLRLLQEGKAAYEREDWPTALELLNKALDTDPDNIDLMTVVADVLVRLGVRDLAIQMLERTIARATPSVGVCQVMGSLATNMGMHEIAEKVWRQAIMLDPAAPISYVNLASAMYSQERLEEVIEFCQEIIPLFPEVSGLWNVLGTAVQYSRGGFQAIPFYEEAVRVGPDNAKAWSNLAACYSQDRVEERIHAYEQSLKASPGYTEAHLGLGVELLSSGHLAEGWKHYDYRLSSGRGGGQGVVFLHDFPVWRGEDLNGKTIYVAAEQGIGDEVLFSQVLPDLIKMAAQVVVSCDRRLCDIFRRSFPQARVVQYAAEKKMGYHFRSSPELTMLVKNGEVSVDYYIPIASALQYIWPTVSAIQDRTAPLFLPREDLVQKWKERLDALGPGLRIGVSWRSGNMAVTRSGSYFLVEMLAELQGGDAHLINLQYGDVKPELEQFRKSSGMVIHDWEDTNLRESIEDNLAIMANLDVVIGPNIATQHFAMVTGVPTVWLTPGRPWWLFGAADGHPPFYRSKGKVIGYDIEHPRSWERIIEAAKPYVESARSGDRLIV
ncbi:tetratricopeptide repeat protein [Gimibacter soli]|uniref:Tetratricopeptide repeat protein n=1 Tax=Gimibacter soli TaxID=3024400 RepID=A0AAE9XQI5_9PROT|nr:tetratricopeptide repeat protein [Gimibacter soli]WCL53065.1 tetratricopeptide repeat protein [Gimibacter soli]